MLRVCERFGKWPHEFYALDHKDQVDLLAFNSLREEENFVEATYLAGRHG